MQKPLFGIPVELQGVDVSLDSYGMVDLNSIFKAFCTPEAASKSPHHWLLTVMDLIGDEGLAQIGKRGLINLQKESWFCSKELALQYAWWLNPVCYMTLLLRYSKSYDAKEHVASTLLDIYTTVNKHDAERPTYVYLIGNTYGQSKIGISYSPSNRLRALQNASGGELQLLAQLQMESREKALEIESQLQKKFKRLRAKGEWFQDLNLNMFNQSIEEIQQEGLF